MSLFILGIHIVCSLNYIYIYRYVIDINLNGNNRFCKRKLIYMERLFNTKYFKIVDDFQSRL